MPRNRPDLFRSGYAIRDGAGGLLASNPMGNDWFYMQDEVRDALKVRKGAGKSPNEPSTDFEDLLAGVGSGDTIWMRGKAVGNFTAPAAVNDVTIIGASTNPRHGSASNTSELGGAAFHATSSSTELFILHTQGWRFVNVLFACPTTNAGVELQSDGGASPEKTVSGTGFYGCRFSLGKYAIEDNGGSGHVTVKGCSFEGQTTASIVNTSTSNALPLGWLVEGNTFGHASATHIDAPASKWTIKNNVFGLVASTAHYIDLTSGANNMVVGNYFAGTYAHADYQDATGDVWAGNYTDAGITTANPAA